jgi:3',5'-cyclic AMP phosphodiesterase CpdA
MKIQYASDLHLEFPANSTFLKLNPLQPIGDILILGGDVVPFQLMKQYKDFFKFCSEHFEVTYWIPGNHEYYYGELGNRIGSFKEDIFSNVHLVNNYWAHHGNAHLIFSTLWTPISNDKAWHAQNGLNDYRLIKDAAEVFSTARSTKLFEENIAFIKEAVSNIQREKCVVLTHHVPTFQHYPEEYRDSVINEAFAVDLDHYIEESGIDYWIFGHHHRNMPAFKIGDTQLLTNQLGYVSYNEHLNFNNSKYVETN